MHVSGEKDPTGWTPDTREYGEKNLEVLNARYHNFNLEKS